MKRGSLGPYDSDLIRADLAMMLRPAGRQASRQVLSLTAAPTPALTCPTGSAVLPQPTAYPCEPVSLR